MIHIRKADPGDKPGDLISRGVLREGRHDLVMVILEDDVILGCGSMEFNDTRGIMNSLYVEDEDRISDIGDALVRTILFTALKQNIESVRIPLTLSTTGFFKKLGINPPLEGAKQLDINLEDFFSGCNCCGERGCTGDV